MKQVASYWAASHIDALLKRYETEKLDELKESIINLSIKHQILTPFTAFLVLETNVIDPPTAVGETPIAAAEQISVAQNYPNPFSLASGVSTTIPFALKTAAPVRIVISDILGRVVRVLTDSDMGAGSHSVQWDGRDGSGTLVAPGMYIVRLQSAGVIATLKLTVVR